MSICQDVLERCYPYLDGELDPTSRADVEAHLERCPPCAARYAGEREFLARVAEAGRETAPPELRARIRGLLEPERPVASPGTVDDPASESAPRWRRLALPLAAAAAVALLVVNLPWGRGPDALATAFAADHARHAVARPDLHRFPEGESYPPPPDLPGRRLAGPSRCVVDGQTYAHYVFDLGGGRHVSAFLPVGGGPSLAAGRHAVDGIRVVAIAARDGETGAVLVSAELGSDELERAWPGA